MNFGLCSFSYRWSIGRPYYRPANPRSIESFLEKTAGFGLKQAMLCNNTEWNTLSEARLQSVREHSDALGIKLDVGVRETDVEAYYRAFDKAGILGASVIRFVYDMNRKKDPQEDAAELGKMLKCIDSILPAAESAGLTLAMENGPFLMHDDIIKIIKRYNSDHLGACVDSMNCVYAVYRPEEVFAALAPYAKMVHLKDFDIIPNKRGYVINGVALGDGYTDWKKVISYLEDANYSGNAYLELYIDRKETEAETFIHEEECVERSVAFARELKLI